MLLVTLATVNAQYDWSKLKFVYTIQSTTGSKCNDSMVGEMTREPWSQVDTCWKWYSEIWNGPILDAIAQNDWDFMTDMELNLMPSGLESKGEILLTKIIIQH